MSDADNKKQSIRISANLTCPNVFTVSNLVCLCSSVSANILIECMSVSPAVIAVLTTKHNTTDIQTSFFFSYRLVLQTGLLIDFVKSIEGGGGCYHSTCDRNGFASHFCRFSWLCLVGVRAQES